MEVENQHLLQSLLPSTATPTNAATEDICLPIQFTSNSAKVYLSSSSGIISRLVFIISVGIVSIWANHEASKGFSISIINEARETSPGKRFDLFYASNDEASSLLLTTSKFVEDFLYPNGSFPKKKVNHVVLRLSSRNLSSSIVVDSGQEHDRGHQFVLHISPSVLEEINFSHAMFLAVQQGMARIWLWDGQGNAPSTLINGIVEYLSNIAVSSGGLLGFGSLDLESMEKDSNCWKSKNPKAVAQFLNYCELEKPGFIGRLNQALGNGWHDRTVDDALGMSAQHLRKVHHNSSPKYLSHI
ncbi:uncharacterized protein LOC113771867 [Coffea eugenioides]|uniref:uncharacterized protein LOC113771867 n=1 Tax=Coffea eugenioides TaxID=49369 RepID=UPI000F6055AF|nr:uncharacterized protein LOC113771867 [Coffea eugenioides]